MAPSIDVFPASKTAPITSRLDDKVAIVTGSGRGIGRGIALELGSRGAKVVVNYSRSADAANEVVREIINSGSDAIAIQADISQPESITKLFSDTLAHFGKVDIVVSNSGIEHFAPIDDVKPEEFDKIFALNTRGQFFVAQAAHKNLTVGGRLVLMSSISANNGIKEHAVYAGSKAAIEAFARCFCKEFGDKKITVNCIAPGGVATDMAADAFWRYIPGADSTYTKEDMLKDVNSKTPLKRMGQPVDIARVVAFLTSEDGGWINGQTLTISGGAAG